jgi:hypothetical protein
MTAALVAVAFALASCGGDDGKPSASAGKAKPKADPQAVALTSRAAGPNAKARSGVVDGSIEITLKGVPAFKESFTSTVSGAFSQRKGSALPDYELDMGLRNYGVELSSVAGKSYVTIGTTGFRLPAGVRARLVRGASRGRNGLTRTLEQFGIAPWRWETEHQLAGTETLDGVEVQKVSTSFISGRILRDANTLLGLLSSLAITRATGVPSRISPAARRVIVSSVTSKHAASWIGIKDKVLRKAGFAMKFRVPKAKRAKVGGISSGTVVGALDVTEVGKPQKISAPESLGSFADFQLALDALGDAQDAR